MRIVQISDDYIELLRKQFPRIMDEKRFHRSHTRKYVGVIFAVGNFNYYAPFSSPKAKDLKADGSVKKNSIFSIYMTKNDENGSRVLLGTIKLINMIPSPIKYVEDYSIDNEADLAYKDIVSDEFKWISENQGKITKKAKQLYNFKSNESFLKNEDNAKVYDAILPFKEIEKYLIDNKLI